MSFLIQNNVGCLNILVLLYIGTKEFKEIKWLPTKESTTTRRYNSF